MDTKKIRAKLLDLAVRGKLVSQDPADEPASVLLGRIREERTKLVREKKAKAPKGGESVIYLASDGSRYEKRGGGEPVCIDNEIPFDVPEGWEWARVGSLCFIGTGATPLKANKSYYENGTVPWITSASACRTSINSPDGYITELALKETNCKVYPPGSLVIAMYGEGKTRGSISEMRIAAATNQACAVLLELKDGCLQDYIRICYERSYETLRGRAKGGTQPNLNQGIISDFLVPVPPLAEQRRIVAELDRLLALVDGVERDSADLGALRARARSKVLDLAVRGLLVPRDASDEPASALLGRIREERAELVREGGAKAPKGGFSVIERRSDGAHYEKRGKGEPVRVEVPYDLPEGWAWARLGTISDYGMAGSTLASDIPDDAWVLDLEDIEKDTGAVLSHTTKLDRPPTSAKRPFVKGKLLYSKLRPYLNKVLIADADGFCTSEIMPIALYGDIVPEFIRLSLMSPYFLEYANRCAYGCKMPRLGTGDGQKALVPIPPLAEQRRIVNRVNQALDFLTNL